ncbi:MAG: DUF3500 domain-containing protein [Acidimicrobiia bacterium]|nr:DUF3500 domain-containing protein [Acidimicrobiia bacterium]
MAGSEGAAQRMTGAAIAWLGSLDPAQRQAASWPFPADEERRRWFYTPTDHGGLTMDAMRPDQQRLAHRLVASGLSRAGYVTAATIIGHENVLDALEGWTTEFGFERGRDPGRYYLRVFGEPGSARWSWRFGGHHVSVQHVVVDGDVLASTPCFLGADPAASPLLGPHLLRPLAGAEDLGLELVRSLDEPQRAVAVLGTVPPTDLVGGNRSELADGDLPLPLPDIWRHPLEGEHRRQMAAAQAQLERSVGLGPGDLEAVRYTDRPKGLAAASMTGAQREVFRALLDTYLGRLPDDLAAREAAKVAGDRLDALHFAWAGAFELGRPHYYRVQGPRLVVELDNTAREANHVHTVWRDPEGDFGDDVLGRHLRQHH